MPCKVELPEIGIGRGQIDRPRKDGHPEQSSINSSGVILLLPRADGHNGFLHNPNQILILDSIQTLLGLIQSSTAISNGSRDFDLSDGLLNRLLMQ
jgi:hypothetical protein